MDTLKSIVAFTNVAGGASATLPHSLSIYGTPYTPDRVTPSSTIFEIVGATTTTVTVRNTGQATASCNVLCEIWHPIDRQFGALPDDGWLPQHLTPQPFVSNVSFATSGGIQFGSGQDGIAIFDGVNVFAFASLVGATYTLTRDIFLNTGEVKPNIELKTGGFRIFCNGTFTVDALGIVSNDGKSAVAGVAGAASALGSTGIGTAGGNGRAANTGLPGTDQTNTLGDASAAGGPGGAGGANAGGAGGTYTPSASNGGANYSIAMLTGFMFGQTSGGNQAQSLVIGGGAGGGGGGSDNAGVTGGGGGGGGGPLYLHAFHLTNNGTIRANGGGRGRCFWGRGQRRRWRWWRRRHHQQPVVAAAR
jgi:hypothetical protein